MMKIVRNKWAVSMLTALVLAFTIGTIDTSASASSMDDFNSKVAPDLNQTVQNESKPVPLNNTKTHETGDIRTRGKSAKTHEEAISGTTKNISKKTDKANHSDKVNHSDKANHTDKISHSHTSKKPQGSSKKKQSLTIMMTGDLMCKGEQQHQAFNGKTYDFRPSFRYVKPIFKKADFVIGNLETVVSKTLPLSKDQPSLQGRVNLNAPEKWLSDLKWAGFDALVLANNHCADGGKIGILETLNAVDKKKFQHTGLFRSDKDKRYMLLEKNGFRIGVLAYANYFNKKEQFLSHKEQLSMLNPFYEFAVKKDVQALKDAGAEYIIAWNHIGTEYSRVPALRQQVAADIMARAGVDYIIDSHPHVLQPSDLILSGDHYVPIMYSMGNFISSMPTPETKETLILSVTLKRDKKGQVKLATHTYYPCYILDSYKGNSFVVMPEDKEYNRGYLPPKSVRKGFKRIKEIVGQLPTI